MSNEQHYSDPIIKMSKPDYKKGDYGLSQGGAIVAEVTFGEYMILKYLFKVFPPTAKLNITDASKLVAEIASGILVKDYAVKKEMD